MTAFAFAAKCGKPGRAHAPADLKAANACAHHKVKPSPPVAARVSGRTDGGFWRRLDSKRTHAKGYGTGIDHSLLVQNG